MLKTKGIKYTCMALLAALLLGGCAQKEQAPEQEFLSTPLTPPAQAKYKTTTVTVGGYSTTGSSTASVIYPVEQALYWEGGSARYRETLVKKGQTVTAGEVLMVFDIESSESKMASLQLQLKRTKEDFKAGKEKRAAAIAAAKKQAQSLDSYDLQIALFNIEKLQAQYEEYVYETQQKIAATEAEIAAIEEEIANNTLVAPFDGVIDSVINTPAGDAVPTNKALVTMHSTEYFLLQVKNGSALRYNLPVTIEYGKGNNKKYFDGKVVSAPNVLPASQKQSYALIQLTESTGSTTLKGSVKYTVINEVMEQILVADKSAIHNEDGEFFVYVLDGDTIHKRYVVIHRAKADVVWIQDGLSEGDLLIID